MKKSQLRQLIREELSNSIQRFDNQYEMFNEMEDESNFPDLKIFQTKLKFLIKNWLDKGYSKQDIEEYTLFVINEIYNK